MTITFATRSAPSAPTVPPAPAEALVGRRGRPRLKRRCPGCGRYMRFVKELADWKAQDDFTTVVFECQRCLKQVEVTARVAKKERAGA